MSQLVEGLQLPKYWFWRRRKKWRPCHVIVLVAVICKSEPNKNFVLKQFSIASKRFISICTRFVYLCMFYRFIYDLYIMNCTSFKYFVHKLMVKRLKLIWRQNINKPFTKRPHYQECDLSEAFLVVLELAEVSIEQIYVFYFQYRILNYFLHQ